MKDMSNFVTEFEKAEENYFEGLTALLDHCWDDNFWAFDGYECCEFDYGDKTYQIHLTRTRAGISANNEEPESGMQVPIDVVVDTISSRTFSDIHHWLVDRFVETYKNEEEP